MGRWAWAVVDRTRVLGSPPFMDERDARCVRAAAARRLALAEVQYRAAQAALQASDCDANRARYRLAIESLKAAEQAAQAALNGWTAVGEA